MIIDVHAHLGVDYTFDEIFPKDQLVQKMKNHDVVQIVQPGTTHNLSDAITQHNDIAALCKEYPGKIFGMACPTPHLSEEDYENEIARCVKELKFVAIKLHTFASGTSPNSKAGRLVFNTARKFGLPVMVHTGSGVPFAAPVNLIGVAKEYSDVKIIMAHCGALILADEAAVALSIRPNIYGDTSWTPGYMLRNWVKEYGPRIMFASDLAPNFDTELTKIKTHGFSEEEQRSIFETTALEVFNLKGKIKK